MIYFDIETIPRFPDNDHPVVQEIKAGIKAPASYKSPEAKAKYIANKSEDLISGQALKCATAKPVCIVAKENRTGSLFAEISGDEEALLMQFVNWFNGFEDTQICGFNIEKYDVPVLNFAMAVHGVSAPPVFRVSRGYLERSSVDLFKWVGGMQFGSKMTVVAKALGIDVPPTDDGSKVWQNWQDGHLDRILEHCKTDVELCEQIHRRFECR